MRSHIAAFPNAELADGAAVENPIQSGKDKASVPVVANSAGACKYLGCKNRRVFFLN